MGARRIEWAQSQRRRGITRQVVSLIEHGGAHLAVVFSEGGDPAAAVRAIADSNEAFDMMWEQLSELHGEPLPAETTLDTAPRPGPWKGWRK
jgi:aminoglycoside phosphotransferase